VEGEVDRGNEGVGCGRGSSVIRCLSDLRGPDGNAGGEMYAKGECKETTGLEAYFLSTIDFLLLLDLFCF